MVLLKNLVEFWFWGSHFTSQSCDFCFLFGKRHEFTKWGGGILIFVFDFVEEFG